MKTFKKLVHLSCRCGRTDRQSNLQPRLQGLQSTMHASPTQPGYGAVVAAVRGKQLILAGSGVSPACALAWADVLLQNPQKH